MKPLIHGDSTLMCEFKLEQGTQLPRHSHPHEQTGYLISGRMDLTIGDEVFTAQAGDSWCIAGGTEHQAVVHEDTLVVEVCRSGMITCLTLCRKKDLFGKGSRRQAD